MVHKILRYHSETNRTAVYIIYDISFLMLLKIALSLFHKVGLFNFSSKLVQFVVINNNVREVSYETIYGEKYTRKTIAGIDDLAKQNGQSREGYIRDLLNHHVLSAEVEGLNMKYETLVQTMSQEWITALNANTKALHKFLEIHGVKIDD